MQNSLLTFFLVLLIGLLVPSWSRDKWFVGPLMVAGFFAIMGRYLFWRVTVTVLPASAFSIEGIVPWIVLLAELLLWAETLLLSVVLCRRTDRSREADAHEARLLQMDPSRLPKVDVFIATYNEPIDVLEKTIAGSMALDWPQDRLNIHVLDDGRREWLRAYCEARGVIYMTRPDNNHAKAGNINAAIARTDAPFILVLDADFVPKSHMLCRAIGFFDDPKIGIVQMPHHFFNNDPVQINLNLRNKLPDEQRFFFDVIQPGRDGWDCAFCCGSNGILRRTAIDSVGGRMPTDSITEDMLLTLTLLRKGFVTRYLGEKLAIGLAPENLDAYFVQRGRWAQGAIQIMYLKSGPFGKGLGLMQRLLFIPSHWLSQSVCQPIAMVMPAFFMLTGIPPLINATFDQLMSFQAPVVLGGFLLMRYFGPNQFYPLSSTVQAVMQAFRIMPLVMLTFLRPTGHGFKVTPKGSDAGIAHEDKFIVLLSLTIVFLTGLGLILNGNFQTRIVEEGQLLPVVAFWAVVNMIILLLVISAAIPRPILRTEERFALKEVCIGHLKDCQIRVDIHDLSLTGAFMSLKSSEFPLAPKGNIWIGLEVHGVGIIPAKVRRQALGKDGNVQVGVSFQLPPGFLRDRLIQKLFSGLLEQSTYSTESENVVFGMLKNIWAPNARISEPNGFHEVSGQLDASPEWLVNLSSETNDADRFIDLPRLLQKESEVTLSKSAA